MQEQRVCRSAARTLPLSGARRLVLGCSRLRAAHWCRRRPVVGSDGEPLYVCDALVNRQGPKSSALRLEARASSGVTSCMYLLLTRMRAPRREQLRVGEAAAALARDARARGGLPRLVQRGAVDAHRLRDAEQKLRPRLPHDASVPAVRGGLISPISSTSCPDLARPRTAGARARDVQRGDDGAAAARPPPPDARGPPAPAPRQPAAALLAGRLPRRHGPPMYGSNLPGLPGSRAAPRPPRV